jgi:hypothetical protein
LSKKRKPPAFVPLEQVAGVEVIPGLVTGTALRLPLLRRVPCAFTVYERRPGENYWLVGVLNEGTELEYMGEYVVAIPAKSKLPPWTAREVAVAAAKKLNEYRGWVTLQRFEDGVPAFAAAFASNSLWTFCTWSTDVEACPVNKWRPDGWRPGLPFPADLPRKEVSDYPPPD